MYNVKQIYVMCRPVPGIKSMLTRNNVPIVYGKANHQLHNNYEYLLYCTWYLFLVAKSFPRERWGSVHSVIYSVQCTLYSIALDYVEIFEGRMHVSRWGAELLWGRSQLPASYGIACDVRNTAEQKQQYFRILPVYEYEVLNLKSSSNIKEGLSFLHFVVGLYGTKVKDIQPVTRYNQIL